MLKNKKCTFLSTIRLSYANMPLHLSIQTHSRAIWKGKTLITRKKSCKSLEFQTQSQTKRYFSHKFWWLWWAIFHYISKMLTNIICKEESLFYNFHALLFTNTHSITISFSSCLPQTLQSLPAFYTLPTLKQAIFSGVSFFFLFF